ncbi:hypothetical protein NUW58_g2677 [Xylaria curta]|uniref:Uncharacterized protein n=1 Tax=Xylaria curta TaxID=42375 RepID=A0ACC1PHL9_9PEZI|nr:hypothetical protein NUW58_g2677 [Xylaria curta]
MSFDVDLWPTGDGMIYIVANTTVGQHAVENLPFSVVKPFFGSPPPGWSVNNVTTSWSYGYSQQITISPRVSNPISLNYSIVVMNESIFSLPDGRAYANSVGVLGLGPPVVNSPNKGNPIDGDPTLLEQLKSFGKISSFSFGMHMGSAQHNQPGSLVLGGYEQNRVLGDIGLFDIDDGGVSHIFLLDVFLDTQVGSSPFNTSKTVSVYKGINDNTYAANLTKLLGGTRGSVLVALDPSVAYIYLPPGTCEAASQYLPVTWDRSTGLYLWNQNDPKYASIIKSPAYLGFIFADRNGSNITIKVPFQLLNLTLSSPLVDSPTPYFPCKTVSDQMSTTHWPLGRAFLQAAFYGVNYEKQITFIAQSPGPDMGTSAVKTIRPNDTTILSDSISLFEKSWLTYWTTLIPTTGLIPPSPDSERGLSTADTAGVAVGSIFGGLLIIGSALWFFWRRTRQTRYIQPPSRQNSDRYASISGVPIELDASQDAMDISDPLPHECE